jgi:hypothetical protein
MLTESKKQQRPVIRSAAVGQCTLPAGCNRIFEALPKQSKLCLGSLGTSKEDLGVGFLELKFLDFFSDDLVLTITPG